VHNEIVVGELTSLGMVVVESLDEIPDGSRVILSAHGVSPEIKEKASEKNLIVIDTTCPFVSRVHKDASIAAQEGKRVVVVGESKHVEVKGVIGEVICAGGEYKVVKTLEDVEAIEWNENSPVRVVVQTTLAEDDVKVVLREIKKRFPLMETTNASSVCTATHDRQKAVRDFVKQASQATSGKVGVLVLGSKKSANTNRLAQIAEEAGAKAWRCAVLKEVTAIDFSSVDILGITAGASTPESLLTEVVNVLR
jgi:4-hydroxy-3-methylbut-2-enyl diphosphate reductase